MFEVESSDRLFCIVLDKWLAFAISYSDIPGLQIAVRKKEKLIFSKSYGLADLEGAEAYTPRHLGHLASQSKMVTSCLTMQLVQDGVLTLDQRLAKLVPWAGAHKDNRFRDITVRDLLSHRSGLCSNGSEGSYWELFRDFPSEAQFIAELKETPLVYAPDTCTKYSNYGFALLGLVLQEVTGKPYHALVAEAAARRWRISELLPDHAEGQFPFATGYSKKIYDGACKPFRHVCANALAPAVGLCGNAESASLFAWRYYCSNDFLTPALREELTRSKWNIKNLTEEFYGLGTMFSPFKDTFLTGHSGSTPGFYSQTRYLAGTDYVFSVVVNGSEPVAASIVCSVARLLHNLARNFDDVESGTVITSDILMNWWGASLYAVSPRRALLFSVSGWGFGDCTALERRADGTYASDDISGYSSVGEAVRFKRDGEKIVEAKFAAFTALPFADFITKSQVSFTS
ncbi:Beta-lactamase family protein [Rhodovastum atsumiense]|uniref:Beta-lactamase family protein n=1 Tax=Rhodovastum atsumiense TaxID=504468 RepID=A0A5M6IKU9_9PROT|nr:serine hydrolase domain-containing protein [Rhodovastum atsumiense]KAA5608891.1 beta-lactamase family protein [Rhodovastum atsumiense]CAH2602309.1 Beta-lactamase family protein [Rhodovastum atsumiense]